MKWFPATAGCFIAALLAFQSGANAGSSWRSELYPEDWTPPHEREGLAFMEDRFIQDFSYAGYHRGEKPLPAGRPVRIDAVKEFGADPSGETDSTRAIQEALDAAGNIGGGVVFLPEGTYRLTVPDDRAYGIRIRHSRVVLRGAGSGKTFLVNHSSDMRRKAVILVRPEGERGFRSVRSEPLEIARDYPGPSSEIELKDSGDLEVNDWVAVHNPFTDRPSPAGSFVEDLRMTEEEYGSWIGGGDVLWGPVFYRRITDIDRANNSIRIDAPTRWYLLQRDGARVYRAGTFIEEAGLEGFSIGNIRHPGDEWGVHEYTREGTPAYDVHASWLIQIHSVRNAWIRKIQSFNPGNDNGAHLLSNGILLRETRGLTLQDLRIGRAQYGGAGGNGYMIRLNDSQETLIRDSKTHHSRHGFAFWGMGTSGNVIHNCVDKETHYQAGHTGESIPIGGRGSDHHGRFSPSNLIDSCTGKNSYFEAVFRGRIGGDPRHGQTSSQGVFWNVAGEGEDYDFAVRTEQFGWGYAIGTRGENYKVVTSTPRAGAEVSTAPTDHVEGIRKGDSLQPPSLYRDQFFRRTGREPEE